MKDFFSMIIQKANGAIFVILGFLVSIFYLKHQAKKEEKLKNIQESLKVGLEIKKDDANHINDSDNVVRNRMRKYVRKD